MSFHTDYICYSLSSANFVLIPIIPWINHLPAYSAIFFAEYAGKWLIQGIIGIFS